MIGKKMMMTDPRYIPPSDREQMQNRECFCMEADIRRGWHKMACPDNDRNSRKLRQALDHAVFMDERDARQRDLIRRLAEELDYRRGVNGCDDADDDCATCKLVAEARGVRQSMSECPNCGSATTYSEDGKLGDPCVRIYECGRWFLNDHDRTECKSVKACELIRSLREELAELDERLGIVVSDRDEALSLVSNLRADLIEARDAERDQIADHLELRASKLEDELAISETSSEVGLERMLAVIKSLRREAQAIRNNEHRSNT